MIDLEELISENDWLKNLLIQLVHSIEEKEDGTYLISKEDRDFINFIINEVKSLRFREDD